MTVQPQQRPIFSLVLATVGRCDDVGRFIDSLALQADQRFELLVVDQNKDDRLVPLLARATGLGLAVRHLRQAVPNLSTARNLGLSHACGDVVAFPDDDCWYEPDTLAGVHAALASQLADGAVVRWVEAMPEPLPQHSRLSWARTRAFRDVPASSIALFFRREFLQRLGGFDGRLGVAQWFGAGEETDLVMRALSRDGSLIFVPQARVHHRLGGGAQGRALDVFRSIRARARGTGALYAKHDIPLWVVVRGIAAPIGVAIAHRRPLLEWLYAAANSIGRLEGMVNWGIRHRERKQK